MAAQKLQEFCEEEKKETIRNKEDRNTRKNFRKILTG